MTADRWTDVVRHPLGFGRLLPLGGAHDGAWLTEAATDAVLRRAAAEVTGVRLGVVRIALADPADVAEPVVPAPPGALPPGPLRLSADFAATAAEPLPAAASRLRRALAGAVARLGLVVTDVDLRVTDLLAEETAEPEAVRAPRPPSVREGADPEGVRVTAAALGVPGVARVTGALSREVHFDVALPRRHVRVEVALTDGPRAVEVARQVRTAVGEALEDRPTVAVLVTSVA
ncbi:nucleopolyhedrovirus P10 family protein [Streptomyces arenae]|uniref:nucleopolyhedrovirus P10 family protein n=1 Tax=Streptomyces arenae TaxID=29301 RepID=UPI002657D641|nr:nucleopolyhedrovirus P10 family protein [Streptomyces arenae]MCG7206165.1 nucleopolyhedrovirus P10 family protein [Streptomyces arenae]